jgi:hypothetical protein
MGEAGSVPDGAGLGKPLACYSDAMETPAIPESGLVFQFKTEGFDERLTLSADGSYLYVCAYHVIFGGQYDEDDFVDTYAGTWRLRQPALGRPHSLLLEVTRGERTSGYGTRRSALEGHKQFLFFTSAELKELDHVDLVLGRPSAWACPCEYRTAHVLSR